jgi:ABC-type transport system involved in multi-copper enzyme maturation permease subunit
MNRAFRSELLKLRRPRLLWGSLGALFGFTVLVSVLSVATAKETPGLLTGFANASRLVGLVILVVFLSSVTTEYSLGTLRILLTRQPDRIAVLGGKLAALLVAMAGALLVAMLLGIAAAAVTMRARGLHLAGGGPGHAASAYLNAVLACALYGAFGLAFGVLLRSTVLAVGVMLGWFFMAENIAANVWPDAPHWLPGLLAGVVMAGDANYWPALAATLAYTAAALAVAGIVFARRDVN